MNRQMSEFLFNLFSLFAFIMDYVGQGISQNNLHTHIENIIFYIILTNRRISKNKNIHKPCKASFHGFQ